MIRIVCGGVFDRFPKLQFVIGHMGEGLPFFFQRLDIIPQATTKLKRPISAYLKQNVHYTFSGMNYPELFLNLLLQLGSVDRIMFSADYPYQSMQQARAFLDQIPASAADKERIAHGNAERLFRL
jgi:predicted TIM-barrel fold metal-dependent hydrolase